MRTTRYKVYPKQMNIKKSRKIASLQPEKIADIWRRYHWFPRQMKSEKRAQEFHTDDASLTRSGQCFRLAESNFPSGTTNQKHYPDQGSDASLVWNFCARFSDVIQRENQCQRRRMSAVFSGYIPSNYSPCLLKILKRNARAT